MSEIARVTEQMSRTNVFELTLAFYILSVFANAFLVRALNKWWGSPAASESVLRCFLGPILWVVVIIGWVVVTVAGFLNRYDVNSRITQWFNPLDNCEVCKGAKGGVRGNENRVNGVVMCDYCHAETMESSVYDSGHDH